MRAFIKGLGLSTCFAALAGVVACGAPAEDDLESAEGAATEAEIQSTFDVNDVSILFPLKAGLPYPQIKATDDKIWTKEVFDQVVAEAKTHQISTRQSGGSDFLATRDKWNVVGLRFDPCAPGFDDDVLRAVTKGMCIVQLRLIAQPFVRAGSSEDFSTHLVFDLGFVKKSELAQSPVIQNAAKLLGEIKDASAKARGGATAGQPLGVHPGLEAEAKAGGGDIGALVKAMVKTLTDASPKGSVAFMGLKNGGPEPWTFFAGRKENNAFTPVPGPIHGQRAQSLDFISGNGPVTPQGAGNSTSPLFKVFESRSLPENQRANAFEIEDSKKTHFFNMDCVSCHTSSSRTHDLALGDGAEIKRRTPVPANITGYVAKTQSQDSSWNVRNFGYFDDKPTVSGRTLTETIEVVEWLNHNVRAPGANLNGPGPDCSKVDVQVWKCFRDGEKDCLAKCAEPPKPTAPVPSRPPVPVVINPEVSGDPCVTATVGGAPTVTAELSGDNLTLRLGGNDSACFSRIFGGVFSTPTLTVECANPSSCVVTKRLASPTLTTVQLTGSSRERFLQFYRAKVGQVFQTRAADGGGLQVTCSSDTCDLHLAAQPGILPAAGGSRINP